MSWLCCSRIMAVVLSPAGAPLDSKDRDLVSWASKRLVTRTNEARSVQSGRRIKTSDWPRLPLDYSSRFDYPNRKSYLLRALHAINGLLSSFADVPGGAYGKDARIAIDQQHPFQKTSTLIVKKVFIPSVFHQLGYDHDDGAIRILLRKVENELNDGNDDEAVW